MIYSCWMSSQMGGNASKNSEPPQDAPQYGFYRCVKHKTLDFAACFLLYWCEAISSWYLILSNTPLVSLSRSARGELRHLRRKLISADCISCFWSIPRDHLRRPNMDWLVNWELCKGKALSWAIKSHLNSLCICPLLLYLHYFSKPIWPHLFHSNMAL